MKFRSAFAMLPLLSALASPAAQPRPQSAPDPHPAPAPESPAADDDAGPGRDEEGAIIGRIKWLREGRVGPDGRFPPNARLKAYAEIEANEAKGLLGRQETLIPGSKWVELGPAPSSGNSGRVTAVAVDPIDNNIVYVGAATGGVWKTTNGGTTWVSLTDTQSTLATGAIALAPSDHNTIYVGTGEANSSCDSYYGAGILKSIDGGATWTLLGNATFNALSISSIVVHPTDPLTAWISVTTGANGSFLCSGAGGANTGIWKTTNGGTTWTRGTNGSGAAGRVRIDPANSAILYGAFNSGGAAGFRKSTDGGATWTNLAGGLPSVSGRADIAIRAADGRLFATYDNASAGGSTWSSTDAGATWTATTGSPANLCNGYCWYFIGVEAAPDGAIWLRGFNDYRSADNGATWTQMTGAVHVDHHAIAFGAGGLVWVGSDGGAYKSANNGSTWTNMNTGLGIMQFYPGASLHPTNANYLMAGAQDNGTNRLNGAAWGQVYGGDGCWTAIDPTNTNNLLASWQYLNIVKSINGGTSFSAATTGLTDSNNSTNAPFIGAFEMCPGNPQNLVAGSVTVWRTSNQAASWAANSPTSMAGGAKFNALAWSKTDLACNTYFAGSTNGQVWRTTVGGGTAPGNWVNISTGLPGVNRGIQDFAVHPTDGNIVYAGLNGFAPNVWKTTNALAAAPTWSSISTGLPNVPVNAVVIDPTDVQTVYIATDTGVFRSRDGGASWAAFSTGLPKVPVFDLVANAATGSLVAFTHGRGAWRLATQPPGEAGVVSPLRVAKNGANFDFSWGAGNGCSPVEYNLYAGDVTTLRTTGYSHGGALYCADATTTAGIPQSNPLIPASAYFLVTAGNGAQEGSYGRAAPSGTEIPASTAKCRPAQALAACP